MDGDEPGGAVRGLCVGWVMPKELMKALERERSGRMMIG